MCCGRRNASRPKPTQAGSDQTTRAWLVQLPDGKSSITTSHVAALIIAGGAGLGEDAVTEINPA